MAAVAAGGAAPAGAGLVSGLSDTVLPLCGAASQPFAPFGDLGRYCAFPNNGFESGRVGRPLRSPREGVNRTSHLPG